MESIVSVVNLAFVDVSSRKILDGFINLEKFSKEEFVALYNKKSDSMSGNDVEQLYYYLLTLMESDPTDEQEASGIFGQEGFSVLALIKEYGNRVLEQTHGTPVCQYRRLMAWRMITSRMDEDIFTTAFLAVQDIEKSWSKRLNFNWPTVIGHNNQELNNLLKKGVVENHFHLKGSGPYFALTWLNLMNDVGNPGFIQSLQEFDSQRLTKGSYPSWDAYEPSYVAMHLQAALIRCFLVCRLTHRPFPFFKEYELAVKELEVVLSWPEDEKEVTQKEFYEVVEELKKRKLCRVSFQEFMHCLFRKKNWNISEDDFWEALLECVSGQHCFELSELEDKMQAGTVPLKRIVFFFLGSLKKVHIPIERVNVLIRADRKECFSRKKECENVYRILRSAESIYEIRSELQELIYEMHSNSSGIGGNSAGKDFLYDYINDAGQACLDTYQNVNRTERWFLYTMFSKLYSGVAEYRKLGNLFYAYLVMKGRIRAELVQVNGKKGFDNFLQYQDRKEYFIDNTRYEKEYSYLALADTWHYQKDFLVGLEARVSPKDTAEKNREMIQKNMDGLEKIAEGKGRTFFVFHFVKEPDKELVSGKQQCRHYRKRLEVKEKAMAIERFRQSYPEEAALIYGIDACSPEIGCRPEVFAQAFTYLRGMQVSAEKHNESIPRLGISYHVGEDFLDIVDGLRAIDEAIHFLHMDSGDRLGHALALGVSPKEWYEFKGKRVLMTKQDHLDNIVWIYMKIRKYNIRHSENILQELHRDFIHCFQEIYGSDLECNIDVYYDAWKLRGDDPEIYLDDCLKKDTEWGYFAWNECYLENKKIRKQNSCCQLYVLYHYDDAVKRRGAEVVECKIRQNLIEVIEQIQKALQKEIARMGISIEANPSSNYMIGTFDRYDQHPIRNLFNKGLTVDHDELMANPQIDVTINTDDQAVFSTYLGNEYAYIALAMEKLRDGNGENVYKRSMIYEWLNNIRRNSKKVCFKQNLEWGMQNSIPVK